MSRIRVFLALFFYLKAISEGKFSEEREDWSNLKGKCKSYHCWMHLYIYMNMYLVFVSKPGKIEIYSLKIYL